MLNKKSIAAALMALFVSVPALAATEGVDYKLAEVEVAPLQKDKIEVTEFFAYWCPHCYNLEPVIARHIKTFASDTVFRAEHIVWDKQRDFGFARLAAAVKQSGTKVQANPFRFVQQRNASQTNGIMDRPIRHFWHTNRDCGRQIPSYFQQRLRSRHDHD